MDEIKEYFKRLGCFVIGTILGLTIGIGIMKHHEQFWYLDIKKEQDLMSVEIKRLDQERLRLLNKAVRLYYDQVQEIWGPDFEDIKVEK